MKTKSNSWAKKQIVASIFIITMLSFFLLSYNMPIAASANSAAPIRTETGSGILFKQHESVQIQSEILDIAVNDGFDPTANIAATYFMKNTSSESLSIETMFITAVYYDDNKDISIQKNGTELEFTREYYRQSDEEQNLDDWESIITEAHGDVFTSGFNYIVAIVYFIDFEPGEELELKVSYLYQMGTSGYRITANLLYYLTPAKYWKDFSGIEINLTLNEKYKKLESSSLKFKKIDDMHYKFKSETLPNTELKIKVSNGSIPAACGCGTLNINTINISGLIITLLFAVLLYAKKEQGKQMQLS